MGNYPLFFLLEDKMSNTEFGLKELTDLTLKTTSPIEVDGRIFEEGEVIARFDKIQIANFKELISRISANGGQNNSPLVIWEDPKEIRLNFTQGIFSKRQFALLSNSNLIRSQSEKTVQMPMHFTGESDEDGKIELHKEYISNVFVYNAKTFEKIRPKLIDYINGVIFLEEKYCDVEIDYQYKYSNSISIMSVGEKLIKGFLLLEGKTRVKDDITGKTHTAILRIPRLRLVSDLSMRLGREADPLLANFTAIGYPDVYSKSKMIMEMWFLDEDIDAEI